MSRRLPPSSSQRPRVYQSTSDNPYRATTLTLPLPSLHTYQQNTGHYTKEYNCLNTRCNDLNYEQQFSDDTNTYYEYGPYYTIRKSDCIYSEDESAVPYYESKETSSKRLSRSDFTSHGSVNKKNTIAFPGGVRQTSVVHNFRKIYPNHEVGTQRSSSEATAALSALPQRNLMSRLSDRPQSSLSSAMTSAVVDGCGGHCQTFENACYYFLQVAFTMGILIGTSLAIAGAVLRKSAARNLQVLVYIGVLLSMVSALLLAIQCSARYSARKRKRALRNAKRAPIPLDTLSRPAVELQQQQQHPLMNEYNQRTGIQLQLPAIQPQAQRGEQIEHQGIPWWRRKDLK